MSKQDTTSTLRIGFWVALLVQVVAVLVTWAQTPGSAAYHFVRVTALFGYITLFWAIISSEYVRQLRKLFGRPFLNLHHMLTRVAWVLILAHPLAYAVLVGSLRVFVPIWSPLSSFLLWASRPALYLIGLATAAGILRNRIKSYWKYIHRLNYLAFLMIFVHAWLHGTDLSSTLLKVIWAAMAAAVLLVAVHKTVGRG